MRSLHEIDFGLSDHISDRKKNNTQQKAFQTYYIFDKLEDYKFFYNNRYYETIYILLKNSLTHKCKKNT